MAVFVANSNILDLTGLRSEVEEAFITDATVTVTIKDADGEEVAGETWPLAMDYLSGSDGDYTAVISEDVAFVAKTNYYAHIDADGGDGRVGHWEFKFKPLTRTGLNED